MSNFHQVRGGERPKVVPFTGELYPQVAPEIRIQSVNPLAPFAFVMCLIAGLALGATAVYQSPQQVELRSLKIQAQQLTNLQKEICK